MRLVVVTANLKTALNRNLSKVISLTLSEIGVNVVRVNAAPVEVNVNVGVNVAGINVHAATSAHVAANVPVTSANALKNANATVIRQNATANLKNANAKKVVPLNNLMGRK